MTERLTPPMLLDLAEIDERIFGETPWSRAVRREAARREAEAKPVKISQPECHEPGGCIAPVACVQFGKCPQKPEAAPQGEREGPGSAAAPIDDFQKTLLAKVDAVDWKSLTGSAAAPAHECDHHWVIDQEAVSHESCQKCGLARVRMGYGASTPLKLEAGKFYRTRDGRKMGPLVHFGSGPDPFTTEDEYCFWRPNGRRGSEGDKYRRDDLIAEWTEDKPAPADDLPDDDYGRIVRIIRATMVSANTDGLTVSYGELRALLSRIEAQARDLEGIYKALATHGVRVPEIHNAADGIAAMRRALDEQMARVRELERECGQWQEASGQANVRAEQLEDKWEAEKARADGLAAVLAEIETLDLTEEQFVGQGPGLALRHLRRAVALAKHKGGA